MHIVAVLTIHSIVTVSAANLGFVDKVSRVVRRSLTADMIVVERIVPVEICTQLDLFHSKIHRIKLSHFKRLLHVHIVVHGIADNMIDKFPK
jgi:hypothetical protein